MMTTQFPKASTIDLEQWAERYAPHQLTAYQYSDVSGYMGFGEWLDLNHPGVLSEFETQHEEADPCGDCDNRGSRALFGDNPATGNALCWACEGYRGKSQLEPEEGTQ